MSDHEFTFGGVPCLIRVQGTPETARMYVICNNGSALRVVADRDGNPVELVMTQEYDALGRAVNYLVERFGERGRAREWPPQRFGMRDVLDEPLTDERPLA
jgi:hypothetical protein